ncbi:MAG: hypothetical protein ABSC06_33025 [Rhodopila sp.]|jgi:hypothetical protein
MTTIAPPKPDVTTFPAVAVEACLLAELIEIAKAEASVRGFALPGNFAQVVKTPIQMDSLSVVSTLCAVEPVLGFELRESIVQTGGYQSIEAALQHLMPKIMQAWNRKKGQKP